MSYIDPDVLHGALTDLISHVGNNSAALTSGGLDPAMTSTKLTGIRDDLASKKSVRDQKKTDLAIAQQAFADSASKNYDAFSNTVDAISGALGKKTPAGLQALGYRTHVTGGSHHAKATPATAAPAAPAA